MHHNTEIDYDGTHDAEAGPRTPFHKVAPPNIYSNNSYNIEVGRDTIYQNERPAQASNASGASNSQSSTRAPFIQPSNATAHAPAPNTYAEPGLTDEEVHQRDIVEQRQRLFIDDDFDFSLRTKTPARSRLSVNMSMPFRMGRPSPKATSRLSKPAPLSLASPQAISGSQHERPGSSNSNNSNNRPPSARFSSMFSPLTTSRSVSTPGPAPASASAPLHHAPSFLAHHQSDPLPGTLPLLHDRLQMHIQQHASLLGHVKDANARIRTLQDRADAFFTMHAHETPCAAMVLQRVVDIERAARDALREILSWHRLECARVWDAWREMRGGGEEEEGGEGEEREGEESEGEEREGEGEGEGKEKGKRKMPECFESLPNDFVVEELFRI